MTFRFWGDESFNMDKQFLTYSLIYIGKFYDFTCLIKKAQINLYKQISYKLIIHVT